MAGQFYAPGAALVPPHQGSHLAPPPLAHTLQFHRGDTMYLYSSRGGGSLSSRDPDATLVNRLDLRGTSFRGRRSPVMRLTRHCAEIRNKRILVTAGIQVLVA
jgi:hypothetical protein